MPQTATREKPIALRCARSGAGKVAVLSPAGELHLACAPTLRTAREQASRVRERRAALDRRDVTSLLDVG